MYIYMVGSSDDKTEKDEKCTQIVSKVNMISKMMKTVQDNVDEIKQKMVKTSDEVVNEKRN